MELNFLTNFPKRMKHVGEYALLFRNIMPKHVWKQYEVDTFEEQTNIVFSVLLFVMEQSLKDEVCTIHDIGNFLDTINLKQLKKPWSFDQCRELADFIVNDVLCDEGRAMYFQGFNYEEGTVEPIHISFIGNKIVYVEDEVRRTSYYLTDDGYNMMLSTLELENNMKLTIHEMIFQLHLQKQSYDKAVDDMKNIFNLLRIQLKRMEEAMLKIRHNALQFSVAEYRDILEGNMAAIDETRKKFTEYRTHVTGLLNDLEQKNIEVKKLDEEDLDNLKHLQVIAEYLNRALDEHQKILSSHFDLKDLYTKELESLSQVSMIKRFRLKNELYEHVIEHPESLDELIHFLRPLFQKDARKTYNLEKALEFQKNISGKEEDDTEELIDFDDDEWQLEQERKQEERLNRYRNSLRVLLGYIVEEKEITLSQIKERLSKQEQEQLIPNLEVFREIMIELLRNREFQIAQLLAEKEEHLSEQPADFQINYCLLDVLEQMDTNQISSLLVARVEPAAVVEFEQVTNELGITKKIRCSDIIFLTE